MNNLSPFVSEKRSQFYKNYAKDHHQDSLDVYMENVLISKRFYPLMHFIEIFLRNKVSKHLNVVWPNWTDLDSGFVKNILDQKEVKKLSQAHFSLDKKNKEKDVNDIISELSFGFWTSLLHKSYIQSIWGNSMKKIFSNTDYVHVSRAYKDFGKIRNFRNRIFHYEQILTYEPQAMREMIVRYLKYIINPKTKVFKRVEQACVFK